MPAKSLAGKNVIVPLLFIVTVPPFLVGDGVDIIFSWSPSDQDHCLILHLPLAYLMLFQVYHHGRRVDGLMVYELEVLFSRWLKELWYVWNQIVKI